LTKNPPLKVALVSPDPRVRKCDKCGVMAVTAMETCGRCGGRMWRIPRHKKAPAPGKPRAGRLATGAE